MAAGACALNLCKERRMYGINSWITDRLAPNLVNETASIHMLWEELLRAYDFLGVLSPRDHGKTSFWSMMMPLYWVDQGYGDVLVLTAYAHKPCRISKERGVVFYRSYGTSLKSLRPTLIVCDDVVTDRARYSKKGNEVSVSYFRDKVDPMVKSGEGKIIVVGSMDVKDGLFDYLRACQRYEVAATPALGAGKPAWPSRYSKSLLKQRKQEIGAVRFGTDFLCEQVAPQNLVL